MKAYHWRPLLEEREAKSRDKPPSGAAKRQLEARLPDVAKKPGMPICIECAFHACTIDLARGKITHWCYNPMSRNPVTGAPTDPSMNRRDKLDCGPFGQFWQAKPARVEKRVEREVVDDSEPNDYVPPVPFIRLAHRPPDDCIAVLWQPGMQEPADADSP